MCRDGANLRVFRDGTQKGSTTNLGTSALFNSTLALLIGSFVSSSPSWVGNICCFRITKGVARYTTNFTPPSLPLPNTAPTPPVADFTGTPTSGTAPLSVAFTDTSTGTPTSWLWEKNDGSGWVNFSGTPTVQNPTESFAAGTWSVRLTATNADGSDTKTRTNYITVAAPAAETPGGGSSQVSKAEFLRRDEEDMNQILAAIKPYLGTREKVTINL